MHSNEFHGEFITQPLIKQIENQAPVELRILTGTVGVTPTKEVIKFHGNFLQSSPELVEKLENTKLKARKKVEAYFEVVDPGYLLKIPEEAWNVYIGAATSDEGLTYFDGSGVGYVSLEEDEMLEETEQTDFN